MNIPELPQPSEYFRIFNGDKEFSICSGMWCCIKYLIIDKENGKWWRGIIAARAIADIIGSTLNDWSQIYEWCDFERGKERDE
jgi:hypothetical protein